MPSWLCAVGGNAHCAATHIGLLHYVFDFLGGTKRDTARINPPLIDWYTFSRLSVFVISLLAPIIVIWSSACPNGHFGGLCTMTTGKQKSASEFKNYLFAA